MKLKAALDAARQGDLLEAARLAEAARTSDLPPTEKLALLNLQGGVAFQLGRLDEAEICFEQTIRMATEQQSLLLIAKASNNLGSIAHLRGKGELAGSLYRSALLAYNLGHHLAGEAQTEHNLSIVLREQGDMIAAEGHSFRACRAANEAGDSGLQGMVLAGAAETALARGRFDEAHELVVKSFALANEADDRIGELEARRVKAKVALRQGRFTVALRDAGRVYLAAQRLGSVQLTGESAVVAAQAALQLDRRRLAERYRRSAQDCYRRLGSHARAEQVTQLVEA